MYLLNPQLAYKSILKIHFPNIKLWSLITFSYQKHTLSLSVWKNTGLL